MELTREDIEKMPQGRAMDWAVAKHIMKRTLYDDGCNMLPAAIGHLRYKEVPLYSLLLGPSMEVLHKAFRRLGGNIAFGDDSPTRVEIYGEVADDLNVPTAICRAALLAGLKQHLEFVAGPSSIH